MQALFQDAVGNTIQGIEEVVAIRATSFLVVPELPMMGALGATTAAVLGLGLFAARKRQTK